MKTFNDTMAVMYVDYYNKHGEEKAYNFILTTKVSLSVLNSFYDGFIRDGIEPLEKVPQDKKEKFWQIACKYYEDLPDRLKASKAVYVLSLITSN